MSAESGPGPLEPVPLTSPETRRERRRRRREREETLLLDSDGSAPPPPRWTRRRVLTVLGVFAIAVAAIAPITLWSRYSTSYVTSRNASVKGSITNVGTQVEGVVASVEVDAGDRVSAGQVIARFEDHQLQANLLRAKSRLSEASARSSASYARIAAAQSESREAKVTHEQRSALASTGAISRDQLRTAETRLQTALAMENTAVADHNAASAEVSTAEADLALARADLAGSVIRAPGDGYVVRRIVEPGASVVVGQPLVALWVGKEVWVEAWVDEDQLSKIAPGNDVKVTINSFRNRTFHGKVSSIGVSTDFELPETSVPQSRTERMRTTPVVPVRIKLDDAQGLFPGLSAVVAIQRTAAK